MPEKLLLVEDDPVFARVIGRTLGLRNYEVVHAPDADQATMLLQEQRFDFAIFDLNLGGQTSLALIPRFKRLNPSGRILILTGYASIATAVEAIKLGADNYLSKPADAEDILLALTAEVT